MTTIVAVYLKLLVTYMQVLIHLVINGLVYAQIDSKTDILSDILSIISVVFIEQNLTVRNLT